MITSALTVAISAEPQRIWRALSDPAEIVHWDESRTGLVEPSPPYPEGPVRWRSRVGGVQLVLREACLESTPQRCLRTQCSSGSLRYEQMYRLDRRDVEGAKAPRTSASLKISSSNRVALLGAELNRFEVRQMMISRIDQTLRSLRAWCER